MSSEIAFWLLVIAALATPGIIQAWNMFNRDWRKK